MAYPPGGGQDILARTLASVGEEVSEAEFRVVNREGAGGLAGHTWFANEAPTEGYNALVTLNPFLFIDILVNDGDFSKDDIQPIAFTGVDPVLHVVNTDSEFGSMTYQEILDFAADNPGEVSVGVIPNNVFQYATDAVQEANDASFNQVDFDGGAPGIQALLGNHVDMTSAFYAEVASYLDAGDLKVVAKGKPSEVPADVPTFDEFGVDPDSAVTAVGRFVALPAGVDEERVQYLTDLFTCIVSSDEAEPAFQEAGLTHAPKDAEETRSTYESDWESMTELFGE